MVPKTIGLLDCNVCCLNWMKVSVDMKNKSVVGFYHLNTTQVLKLFELWIQTKTLEFPSYLITHLNDQMARNNQDTML